MIYQKYKNTSEEYADFLERANAEWILISEQVETAYTISISSAQSPESKSETFFQNTIVW